MDVSLRFHKHLYVSFENQEKQIVHLDIPNKRSKSNQFMYEFIRICGISFSTFPPYSLQIVNWKDKGEVFKYLEVWNIFLSEDE